MVPCVGCDASLAAEVQWKFLLFLWGAGPQFPLVQNMERQSLGHEYMLGNRKSLRVPSFNRWVQYFQLQALCYLASRNVTHPCKHKRKKLAADLR